MPDFANRCVSRFERFFEDKLVYIFCCCPCLLCCLPCMVYQQADAESRHEATCK